MNVERIRPATDGLNTEASPEYVGSQQATTLQNMLTHRAGKLPMRGSLQECSDNAFGGGGFSSANAIWTHRTSDTEDAVIVCASGTAYLGSLSAGLMGTFSSAAVDADAVNIRGQAEQLGDYTWGPTSSKNLMRWDGTAGGFIPFTNVPWTGAIRSLAVHLERLFVIDAATKSLYWSDLGGPSADALTSWQDDASGLTNQIGLPSTPLMVCRVGTSLAIFYNDRVQILRGDAPSSFVLRTVTDQRGVIGSTDAIPWDQGCIFRSADGIWFCDGSDFKLLSGPVNQFIAGNPGSCALARLASQYLFVSLYALVNGPDGLGNFVALLHVPTGTWSTLTSDIANLIRVIPPAAAQANAVSLLFDGTRVWKLDDMTATTSTFGSDTNLTTSAAVATKWYSRMVRLSTPTHKAVIHRLFVDYALVIFHGNSESATGWYVTVYDGDGSVRLAEQQLEVQTDPAGELFRKRAVLDCYIETNDVQVRLEWRSSSLPPEQFDRAELYDVWIEYEPAQRKAGY